MDEAFDLLVVGGGINGAGIARDAAGRGMRVLLVEKDDLASHTSSASTKLIHGGLRYLEQYEFRLVREGLREREVLLAAAPHIIWPLRFVLPHEPTMRPRWMLRAGLFLYDSLGGRRRSLPGSRAVDLTQPPHRAILQPRLTRGFEYSDCWVEDSRLVLLTAMDAAERGAQVATRCECIALARDGSGWTATLRSASGERQVRARALVNAAGPFVDQLARRALGQGTPAHLRLVKGSHIVVRRAYAGEHAYIFQQDDGRIVFAIPYERDFTLVGTTDVLFEGDLDAVAISGEERDYLLAAASSYFRSPLAADEIVHSYSGVRPLYEDEASRNSRVTRDYTFELDHAAGAPMLSVYGGKLTTYRKLAEHALQKLAEVMPVPGPAWTATTPLPGGDMAGDFAAFLWRAHLRWPWLAPETLQRLARAYGTRLERVLGEAASEADLGELFGPGVFEAELRYAKAHEWALSGEDFLWRRSKLGLHLGADSIRRIADWFAARSA